MSGTSPGRAPSMADVRARREAIARTLAAHGARNPRILGSVARGDAVPESDIDLVVDFDGGQPVGFRYFGMIRALQAELSAILGRPVHVVQVTRSSRVAGRALDEAVPLSRTSATSPLTPTLRWISRWSGTSSCTISSRS